MALVISIKVIPSSGRQEWALDKAGELKCYLKSQPEKGLANKELIKFLAHGLRLTQVEIVILAGDKGRKKKIKIDADISYAQLLALLGLEP